MTPAEQRLATRGAGVALQWSSPRRGGGIGTVLGFAVPAPLVVSKKMPRQDCSNHRGLGVLQVPFQDASSHQSQFPGRDECP